MRRSAIALFLCVWLTATAPQPVQNAATGPDANLTFATTTQLVVEDVLIKGKDGKPILGLKPTDFTITEDGKPQKISVFEFQTLEGELADSASVPVNPTAQTAAPKPPEKPGVKPSPPSISRPNDREISNIATAA